MRWRKTGHIYSPPSHNPHHKLLTHAANPLAIAMSGDVYRIYYNGRDAQNRSSVGAVDIDVLRREIIQHHHDPFFVHGNEGSFLADGVSIGSTYEVNGVRYILFMGWNTPPGRHWRGDIGRLVVSPELTLSLESKKPFLGATAEEPLSLSYPWVRQMGDGSFAMWYGSTHSWAAGNGEMLHVLHHATSPNGRDWQRLGQAVPHILGTAQAFSRPTVWQDRNGTFHMWFSFRGNANTYRIGYANSADALSWRLDLEATGISVSSDGWDSEMIEYPFVFEHGGHVLMLYNGNGYGKTGFGLASLET